MGERFRLVFAGDVVDGHRIDQVQRELAELLHLSEARQLALFSGRRTVLKRDLGFESATRYALRLERTGAKVLIEAEPPPAAKAPARTAPPRRATRSPFRKVWFAGGGLAVMTALAVAGWWRWGWESPAAPRVTEAVLVAHRFSPSARAALLEHYWPARGNKAFAVSAHGAWGFVSGAASDQEATQRALADCEGRRGSGMPACRLVNVAGVWSPVAP